MRCSANVLINANVNIGQVKRVYELLIEIGRLVNVGSFNVTRVNFANIVLSLVARETLFL